MFHPLVDETPEIKYREEVLRVLENRIERHARKLKYVIKPMPGDEEDERFGGRKGFLRKPFSLKKF